MSADPHVVHVEGARGRIRIIPKGAVKKTRLNQITAAAGDNREAFWFTNPAAEKKFWKEPIEISRHRSAAETKRSVQDLFVIMKISLERVRRINPVVIHNHDERVAATESQFLLD